MDFVKVKNVSEYDGKEVKLRGWVFNLRKSGKIWFLVFRDGTGIIQCVVLKNLVDAEVFDKKTILTQESSVIITGTVRKEDRAAIGYEITVSNIEIVHVADEYPIGKKEHGADFLLSNRHLWLRSKKQTALMKIRHTVYYAITDYLNSQDFYRFDSPILTPNACEGTTTLFEVPYFDEGTAFLSQSGQLYLETGIMALGRCYDFGPVFRAEKSKTRKHLTEFWMMDAEAAYVKHDENMDIQEGLIRHVIRTVIERNEEDLKILERDIEQLKKADAPFIRMTHKEAIDKVNNKGGNLSYNDDFGSVEESMVTDDSDVPVFIERWPAEIKAFYMKRDENDSNIVLGDDLIAPEGFGEIIGGSEREDNHDMLLERMKSEDMDIEPYQWYLDLRKYGSVPHSGFGIGLERLVGWVSGVKHIRETIPFPRTIYRLNP